MVKFIIKLKAAHERSGRSVYSIHKKTGLSQTTIHKYVNVDKVEQTYIPAAVIVLCKIYEVDWRDSAVIEVKYESVA